MATVTGYTTAYIDSLNAAMLTSGAIVGDNLILTKNSGSTVNAGNVRGPSGLGISTGLIVDRPAASVATDELYFATDSDGGTLYLSDGTTWFKVGPSVNAASGRIVAQCKNPADFTNAGASDYISITGMAVTIPASTKSYEITVNGLLQGTTTNSTMSIYAGLYQDSAPIYGVFPASDLIKPAGTYYFNISLLVPSSPTDRIFTLKLPKQTGTDVVTALLGAPVFGFPNMIMYVREA